MAAAIDSLALFPLVFAALVLQKTYIVSKQALVPSVVRDERELVEANSKLGLIAGSPASSAVIPAGRSSSSSPSDRGRGTLIYAAAAVRLRPRSRDPTAGRRRRGEPGADRRAGAAALDRAAAGRAWR